METKLVQNGIVKELTGKTPGDNTGMFIGMLGSAAILGGVGGAVFAFSQTVGSEGPSAGNFLLGAVLSVGLGVLVGFLCDKMGWLDSDLDGVAERLTYDSEDYVADNFGLKSWNYDREREMEVAGMGCFLATAQFFFGTLWRSVEYFAKGEKGPIEGFRGPVAVVMYLNQAGRSSQEKLVRGLEESGLPEAETIAGLAMLKKIGFVVGNSEGFLLTQKAKDECGGAPA